MAHWGEEMQSLRMTVLHSSNFFHSLKSTFHLFLKSDGRKTA